MISDNTVCERFNRTLNEEFIQLGNSTSDIEIFNTKLIDWLIWYNTNRFHWSLQLTSPVDYLISNGFISNFGWTNTKP